MSSVEEILKGKYPAKDHARRVSDWIVKNGGSPEGVLYLEAQKLKYNEDNDQEACFRQVQHGCFSSEFC
jgi:Xaa-Pro dipeptidase